MRAVLGVLSLVVVLAFVGVIAKKQLAPGVAAVGAASAPRLGDASAGASVSQQAKAIEDDVRERAQRAVQEGAERNRQAEQP